MLPQELKTPLVPDSEMCTESSTMGFAGDKRKAGPDALSNPDAKKIATSDASTGLPKEDKTPLEGSSASTGLSELPPCYDSDDDVEGIAEKFVYEITGPGDFKDLEKVVANKHPFDSAAYTKRVEGIKSIQHHLTEGVDERAWSEYYGKVHMKAYLNEEGNVGLAFLIR